MTVSRVLISLGVCVAAGCQARDDDVRPEPVLFPTAGKVTVDGKPLAKAVILFLAIDDKGTTTQGETDENGDYTVSYQFRKGTAAGKYRVAVRKMVTPQGQVLGMDVFSSFTPSPLLREARDIVPARYSDMGRSELMATVPVGGGSFNFELKGPLEAPPEPAREAGSQPGQSPPAAPPSAGPAPAEPRPGRAPE